MLSIKNSTSVSLALCLLLAIGCASKASQQGQQPATETSQDTVKKDEDTKADKKPNTGGSTSIEGYECDGGTALKFTEGKYDIKGNSLTLYKGRSKSTITLCEVLKKTGKKAAIFQFAGWSCVSCMDEAKELQKFVTSAKGKDVAHILVFTDFFEDTDDADFQDFIGKYAGNATVMYDESELWKTWSKVPSEPSRATIMTMNLNSEARIYNEEGQFNKIFDAAIALVDSL